VSDPQRCLTLLTDYGYQAGFVGTLHAVAFRIAPRAAVIDLDHSIPPGNVRLGALRLERLARVLPSGVHVAVVDPGVGGARRPVAVQAGDHVFVGPDNGLLIWGAEAVGGIGAAVVLDDQSYFLEARARTFDGRDIFVPVAAHLLEGTPFAEVGSSIDPLGLVRIERPVTRRRPDGSLDLEVVQVDGFGNVQFGAGRANVTDLGLGDRLVIDCDGSRIPVRFGSTFTDVDPGAGVLLLDSDGQLAFSVNGGRADSMLPVTLGGRVVIRRAG
jgi:S-adenosylmethionine hydrolase